MSLPPLREELRLHAGGSDRDGSPLWLIHDPVAHRFYRIGWLERELLSRWGTEPGALLDEVARETTLRPTPADLERLLAFLGHHQLLRDDSPAGTALLCRAASRGSSTLSAWLIHHYLFFRIPLLRPERLLDRLYPLLRPLFSGTALIVLGLCALAGLYLASRQWDSFTGSLLNTLTPSGVAGYLAALFVAKSIHELGHALTAKHFGVRVPRMGIALLVLWPVLYTDTSESWLLRDSRQRLLVAAGGILAEGVLAVGALLAWGLLGDGPLRQSLHFLAVVSLARTLLLNSSPFMRFDGYYLLSDLLDLPNLQERAFALLRQSCRRLLFGCDAPPSEFSGSLRTFLVGFALATWLYRLVIFLGIAFAVYRLFFKPLGIFLMLVEIWYFILRPVVREVAEWRKAIPMTTPLRKVVLATLLVSGCALLFVPLRTTVALPAYLTAGTRQLLYPPYPARLVAVTPDGTAVRKGEVLFRLEADEPNFQARQATSEAAALREQARRQAVSDVGRGQVLTWSAAASEKEQLARSQVAEQQRLVIRAETDGVLVDLEQGLRPGGYVTPRDPLGMVVQRADGEIEALASEEELGRIQPGSPALFRPDTPQGRPARGTVVAIDQNRLASLPTIAMADRHGGAVATQASRDHQLVPAASLYRVRIKPDQPETVARLQTGQAIIAAERASLAARLVRQAVSVLVRESGF